MSQITALLKAVYELKNEEAINSMTMVRTAIWAEEKDFKKITDSAGPNPQQEVAKVPDSFLS